MTIKDLSCNFQKGVVFAQTPTSRLTVGSGRHETVSMKCGAL